MNKNSIALLLLIPAVLLILAPLIAFPYGFYTLLRLIVSVTAGFIIFYNYKGAGGINEITIREYAECGVDFISSGALTHSVYNLDLSLKAVEE